MLSQITPLIRTFNEARNIDTALGKLRCARKVFVVDSFSSDETEPISREFDNVVFAQRQFDNHSAQWNFGLERIQTEWVLSLDADYVLTDGLIDEISALAPPTTISAYFARFHYCVAGRRASAH